MILPTKHLGFERSLLALGASVMSQLVGPVTVSRLWTEIRESTDVRSFDEFSLVLSFLFSIGAIELHSGLVRRVT